ncbi:polysaccharide pyruvyl transferase family protein [Echinicola sp. 20G]|uniref:polysaccharide pyruvyl transferase family protein n=1 Tax=Echinicola sp. 20G TaxID=2781961 RepID=UPI0019107D0D|nr:polysaccharide pyruvyl transferase family protein [Echinicola sp. 20G]
MNQKILITHVAATLNYGSAMMALNLISRIKPLIDKETEIYCECDDFNFERIKTGTGCDDLKQYQLKDQTNIPASQKFQKYFLGKDESISEITDNFDMLIVLGGDDLSEVYKKGAILKGSIYNAINKKCKVILAGQSFGPFSGTTKLITSRLYKNIPIISRDDNSYEFSKKIGIKKTVRSRDLALLPLPYQEEFGKEIRKKYPEIGTKYITLVSSGLWRKYHTDKEEYVQTWLGIIDLVKVKFPDHKIVLLGHVLAPLKSDDRVIINEIINHIGKDKLGNIIPITEILQPAEAREILGGSYMIITGRMHAAVSSFFMRKPAISLAYSEKYAGVIGRGLGLPETIIDCRNRPYGRDSIIIQELDKKINNVESVYDSLVSKIDEKVSECSKMVMDQVDFIVKEINELKTLKYA